MTTTDIVRQCVPRFVRNWLRNPYASARYLVDRAFYSLGTKPTATPLVTWGIPCHPAALQHFNVFRTDPIQRVELECFVKECQSDMHLLDIGAHYGVFALAAVHFGGPSVRVLSAEASPAATKILRINVKLNNADNQVTIVNCAVGDLDGELAMLDTGPNGSDYFMVPTEDRTDTIKIQQRSLVSLIKSTNFHPTHIKIDIESYEFEVILGAQEFLKEHHPILFLEVHGRLLAERRKSATKLIDVLVDCGYSEFMLNERNVTIEEMRAADFNCRLICRP